MSVTLWLNTEQEQTVELGGTIPVYEAFAEMAHTAGEDWLTKFDALSGVLSQCETQEDADSEWLARAQQKAAAFLEQYRDRLSSVAVEILEQLVQSSDSAHPGM